jgi:2-dehydropantoate 2-reductase
MKIAVLGAGAIGGLLAAKLSLAGNSVSVIDHGLHLQVIQTCPTSACVRQIGVLD